MPLTLGSHLGPYEIVSSLGADGTGGVYWPHDTRLVPCRCTLDGFADTVSRTPGVDLTRLDPITILLVRTVNSLYRIMVREPHRRAVWVQGGAFFPKTTCADLNGSSFGGSRLKMAWVGIGLHMEFHCNGQ